MSCVFVVCNIEWVQGRGGGKGSMSHSDSVPTIESMIVVLKSMGANQKMSHRT